MEPESSRNEKCCLLVVGAEAQHWQEETERQRALQEQTVLDKDSQLAGVQAELDSCQARVRLHLLTQRRLAFTVCWNVELCPLTVRSPTWRWRWRP